MSEAQGTMPTGWMDAETARKWARRGVWAYRFADCTTCGGSVVLGDEHEARREVCDGESWRYIGPHPDDDAAAEPNTVEVEAWVVLTVGADGVRYDDVARCGRLHALEHFGDMLGAGHTARLVRLTARVRLPEPVAVETVQAVADE